MTFDLLVFARMTENALKRKNILFSVWENIVYNLLSYINLPYKMKLIDSRIKTHKNKLEKYENLMNSANHNDQVGKKINQIR